MADGTLASSTVSGIPEASGDQSSGDTVGLSMLHPQREAGSSRMPRP